MTACRPGEAAHAKWSKFDFEERLWRRFAEKMKARCEHVSEHRQGHRPPHSWRTTFSTWANESGHRLGAIEKQLAHTESNKVRATYNKALLAEERRQIMQACGDYLAMAEAENVNSMRRMAASPTG